MEPNQIQTRQLRTIQLRCVRDDRVLFEDLCFTLNSGQALLIEGPNGSGKTSLLRLLCGFRQADSGDIVWCGKSTENNAQYFTEMAYVGHLDGIKKELTVEENLKLAQAMTLASALSIEQALVKVRMAGYEDMRVGVLSAGQKRRVAFARLLITRNRLWILDEPYTALDKSGIALFEKLMTKHVNNGGMMVLTSHHDVNLPNVDLQTVVLG